MSADNYLFVRKRKDGMYGISHRFASTHYRDEVDEGDCPPGWIVEPPPDRIGVHECAEDAIMAAHHEEIAMGYCEYGVCLGDGVLDSA